VKRDSEPLKPIVLGLITSGVLACGLGLTVLQLTNLGALPAEAGRLPRIVAQVVILSGFGLATVGLGLAVFAPVAAGPGPAARGYGTHRVMLVVTAFATLSGALVGNLLPLLILLPSGQREPKTLPSFLLAAVSVSAVLLAVAYLRFIRPGVVGWPQFGFGRNLQSARFGGLVWLAHLLTGIGGGLLVILLSLVVQVGLWLLGVRQTQLDDFTWVRSLPPSGFLLVWLAGSVLAPLSEEVFFRGLIFGSYYRVKGPLVAYTVSALVFALLHLNLPAIPPIFVLGLVLAWLYRRTGSLTPCVVAHGLNNGLAFLMLYLRPDDLLKGG
jgi:CAAX protease family protein